MSTRVDVHTHFLPAPYRDLLREWGKEVRIENRDGVPHAVYGRTDRAVAPGFRDFAARAEWMADHAVDVTVASISNPSPFEAAFSDEESTELVRAINDGFAAAAADHEGFVGLASVPFLDPEAAVEELDRVAHADGLVGVAVPTSVRGTPLSAPEFAPIFERIDHLDLPVFVHPMRNVISEGLRPEESGLDPTVVFPVDTTVELTRLIWDGFFDRYDLDLLVAHMGGALPYLVGRLERGRQRFRSDDDVPPARPMIEYVREFSYDAISFHGPAVGAALETVGPDHLMFGTDYPFNMENAPATLADVEERTADESARETVLGGAAVEFFDL
jgi:aminocarboxymuconate-semialdehyde decarboxylase